MPSNKKSQPTLSSYFSPSPTKSTKRRERPASPIDLTSDNEENDFGDEPPIKKVKVARPSQSRASSTSQVKKRGHAPVYVQSTLFSQTLSTPPRSNARGQTHSRGVAEQWAFVPQPSFLQSTPSVPEDGIGESTSRFDPQKEAEKAKRHEAFKKKLLTNDNRFKLRPGVLGTADTINPEELAQSSRTPVSEGEDAAEDSGDDSDPAFREVMNMFSSSVTTNRKGKKRATTESSQTNQRASTSGGRRSNKPPPKIGPSGQAYTPLELQVRSSLGRGSVVFT